MIVQYKKITKKSFLLLFLILGSALYAQEISNSVTFATGYEPDGFLIRGGYSRGYDQHILSATAQVNFESFSVGAFDEKVNAQQYAINLEYHYEFLELNGRDFVFSGGGGGIVGYENIPDTFLTDGGIIQSQSDTMYGGFLSVNVEKFLTAIQRSNALMLVLNVRYNYFIQSQLGAQQFNAAIGARYSF